MYVETYETSSKWNLFNMRFIAMFITAVCVLFLIKCKRYWGLDSEPCSVCTQPLDFFPVSVLVDRAYLEGDILDAPSCPCPRRSFMLQK